MSCYHVFIMSYVCVCCYCLYGLVSMFAVVCLKVLGYLHLSLLLSAP